MYGLWGWGEVLQPNLLCILNKQMPMNVPVIYSNRVYSYFVIDGITFKKH